MPYKKIICATDGSPTAEHAQRVAAAIAKASRAQLILVHGCSHAAQGEAVVQKAKEQVKAEGVTASTEVHEGDPVEILVEIADRKDAGLIVLGSRGLSRTKRFFQGSVSHGVAHHAPCDVLIVRARPFTYNPPSPSYKSIAVATDGSPTADRAARKGLDLARKLGASATLVFVGHPSTGDPVLRDTLDAAGEGMDAKLRVVGGDAADRIVEVAEAERADLIVVGNKGMTGASRFLLGSVPQKVLEHAHCDVLVARTITQVSTEILQARALADEFRDIGEVHTLGVHGWMELGRQDLGLPVPRFAIHPDGRGSEWAGYEAAREDVVVATQA